MCVSRLSQEVTRGTLPSCIVAAHSDGCRERMEILMMQDPVGADRAVRTKTRHDAAFARHVGRTRRKREKDRKKQSRRASGAKRADCNVQHKLESNDNVHKQDVDMNNDN